LDTTDQTRRTWIVTIGQAAVGLGVAGSVQGNTEDAATLPPGVYQPSTDRLSHALMSAERYHPIPPGCPTDYVRPTNGPFEPLFFSVSEFPVIRHLIQLLLGDISDDGGVSQEVAEWIDLRVSSADGVHQAALGVDPLYRALATAYFGVAQNEPVAAATSARICREGLEWIFNAARAQHSKEFMSLDVEQQIAILHSIGDERPDKQREDSGTRFFAFLKPEIIRGFYTSRAGLKELDFKGNAFYARSPGCTSKQYGKN